MMMNAQMGLFASFGNASQVQVYGACTLLAMMLFCGFIITPDNIPKYFVWVYWWNPFAWAYRALVINEFRSARWDDPHTTLEQNGFIDNQGNVFGQIWVGYAFLFMVPYWLLCCVASAMGLSSFIPDTHALSEVFGDHADLTACQKERITIPFTPVTLSFCDVCYEVTASTTKEQLKLLKNVNGIFRPGKMCALMVCALLLFSRSKVTAMFVNIYFYLRSTGLVGSWKNHALGKYCIYVVVFDENSLLTSDS